MRLGGQPQDGQLPAGAVPALAPPLWPKKAICAVAASILTAVYHMLRDGTYYHDLGAGHFRCISPETQGRRMRSLW